MPEAEAIHEPIRLVPYDDRWPAAFAAERDRLLSLFPAALRGVEHVGSTAVPGMPAKPIVDLLAGVDSMAAADALFDEVLRNGYTTSRAFNQMLPDRRWFMRSAGGHRTHHLHVVVLDSPAWHRHLVFRDRLRSDAGLAQSYARLKSELAARFEHDREAYTEAKSGFVASVLAQSCSSTEPPWLQIARAETGVRIHPPGASNPRITAYHAGTNIAGYDDKASWCSSFVHWSLGRAGIEGTRLALARSWLTWGERLASPVVGCITVLWRDDPASWKGHVGFFLRLEGDRVHLFGGNQLDEVREHSYPAESILGHRWPPGHPVWPENAR